MNTGAGGTSPTIDHPGMETLMFLDIATTDGTAAFVRATTGERFEKGVEVRVTSPLHARYGTTGTISLVFMKDVEETVCGRAAIISIPSAIIAFPSGPVEIPTALLTTTD